MAQAEHSRWPTRASGGGGLDPDGRVATVQERVAPVQGWVNPRLL
jgi:hypothetical protein